jgi:hypothetical protein
MPCEAEPMMTISSAITRTQAAAHNRRDELMFAVVLLKQASFGLFQKNKGKTD